MAKKTVPFSDVNNAALQAVAAIYALVRPSLRNLPSPDDPTPAEELAQFRERVQKLSDHFARFCDIYEPARPLLEAATPYPSRVSVCGENQPYAHDVVEPLCKRVLKAVGGLTGSYDGLELWRKSIRDPAFYRIPGCDELERLRVELQVENPRVEAAVRVGKAGKRQSVVTRDEANVCARAYLAQHAQDHRVTTDELRKAIGCSRGLIPKLPAWRTYQERLRQEKPSAPRAVRLTDRVLAAAGQDDKELQRLIAEQQEDDAADRGQSRRRPTL